MSMFFVFEGIVFKKFIVMIKVVFFFITIYGNFMDILRFVFVFFVCDLRIILILWMYLFCIFFGFWFFVEFRIVFFVIIEWYFFYKFSGKIRVIILDFFFICFFKLLIVCMLLILKKWSRVCVIVCLRGWDILLIFFYV